MKNFINKLLERLELGKATVMPMDAMNAESASKINFNSGIESAKNIVRSYELDENYKPFVEDFISYSQLIIMLKKERDWYQSIFKHSPEKCAGVVEFYELIIEEVDNVKKGKIIQPLTNNPIKSLHEWKDEIAKKFGYEDYRDARIRADTDRFHRIEFEAQQKFDEQNDNH